MGISLKHAFTSAVAEGADATKVRTSNWNAEHVLTQATGKMLGRSTAGTGATEELEIALGEPGGRLTLASATPVMTSTQSGKTVIYYALYKHDRIPLYNGTNWVWTVFAELTNDTTASSTGKAGPAAVTTNSNYDLFVWNDAGTSRLTRGPAWTSDTARGTGAGTTELQRLNGIWTNKVAITNGPGANAGTYVGTVRSNGSSQIDYIFAGAAGGGTAGFIGVWNMYNRVNVAMTVHDTTASWSWTSATVGPLDPGATGSGLNNRISFVCGLAEDAVLGRFYLRLRPPTVVGAVGQAGIGLDTTTAFDATITSVSASTNAADTAQAVSASYVPQLGFHYVQALQCGDGNSSSSFGGNNQNGMTVELRG